jgi:hypothetical protein
LPALAYYFGITGDDIDAMPPAEVHEYVKFVKAIVDRKK